MTTTDKLSGLDKAAILFKVLGNQLALSMFKDLSEDEIIKIRQHIKNVENIPFKVKKAVLEDFYFSFISEKFKSSKKEESKKPFDFLENLTLEQIVYLLSNETPRIIAITLAQLDVERQVEILKRFDGEMQSRILVELGNLDDIPLEAVVNIAAELKEKSQFLPAQSEFARGGGKNLARILDRLDPEVGELFIDKLEKESPELAKEVKKYHVTFDDLIMIPENRLGDILRGVEARDIAWALKGKSEEFKQKFIQALPEKTQLFLKDEMELIAGPQPKRKVEAARKLIVDAARKLEEEDETFRISDYLGGEEYIE